jgi:DNA-binding MarR family transcriptional regulator
VTPSEDLAISAWGSFLRAKAEMRRVLHKELRLHEHGLRSSQLDILGVLANGEPEGVKLRDLSEQLHVTCANVTGLVDRLEQAGYISREPQPGDRRVILARLTQSGARLCEEVLPLHQARVVELMSCLSEREQAVLTGLLDRLADQAAIMADRQTDGTHAGSPAAQPAPAAPQQP